MTDQFDAGAFWRGRMYSDSSLVATGTSGMPLTWQRWMYRSKKRVLTKLVRNAGISLQGKTVVDFGCGNGYFESVWEAEGAARADGIDISPEAVQRLRASFPHRRYLSTDLGSATADLRPFETPTLVTAIDVLYHIVDDNRVVRTLEQLISLLRPGGHLLITEGTHVHHSLPHVRCRSDDWWKTRWAPLGLELVATAPVFIIQDRAVRGGRHLPSAAGWMLGGIQYALDIVALQIVPAKARTVSYLLRLK